jgi:uncharacterized protein HemX
MPVATPAVVTAPVTPVIEVVAAPIIAEVPIVAVAEATPAPTVVVNAEPAVQAAQVLFLSEQALTTSATGTVTGALLLVAALGCFVLAAGLFLQKNQQALRKPAYLGGIFTNKKAEDQEERNTGMLGEYLLIRQ